MYESFFSLKRRPFAAMPDPDCWYHCDRYQSVLDELLVCAEQGQGIGIVVAPAGVGKTLLCERLVRDIGEPFTSVLLRHTTFQNRRGFLQTLLCELAQPYDLATDQELRLALAPVLRGMGEQGRALLLVIDEAHLLSEKLLEELRILADQGIEGRPLVRLILCGQLSLEEKLAHPRLQALNQRVRAHITFPPLTLAESADYIDYRVTWAGGRTAELFTPEALDAICRAADGIPRCLNQLCDHVLLLAYVAEQQPVTVDLVYEALEDLQELPLSWNTPTRRESLATFETSSPPDHSRSPEHSGTAAPTFEFEFGGESASDSSETADEAVTESAATHPAIEDEFATIEDEFAAAADEIAAGEPAASEQDSGADWEPVDSPSLDSSSESPLLEDDESAPDTWSEELVIDRYNALDAGLPLQPDETPTQSEPEAKLPFSGMTDPLDLFQESAADLLRMPGTIEQRLEIIQQVLDYVAEGDAMPSTRAAASPAAAMRDDRDDTDETGDTNESVETGETFDADHRAASAPAESLAEQLLDDAGIEHAALENDSPETPTADILLTDSGDGHAAATAPQPPLRPATGTAAAAVIEIGGPELSTSATESRRPEASPRPVRNLFTLLRRKQQGRL